MRTNNKLDPHITPGSGFEPGPYIWLEENAITTAPFPALSLSGKSDVF